MGYRVRYIGCPVEPSREAFEREMERLPNEVLVNLHKARMERHIVDPYSSNSMRLPMKFAKVASINSWEETLFSSIVTETALTAAAEAAVFPVSTAATPGYYGGVPGGYMIPHRTLHLRCAGQLSTAATPGTFLFRIRWGNAITDTALVASNGAGATGTAVTMAASQTNVFWRAEWYITSRAEGAGTAGSLLATGILETAGVPTTGYIMFPATAPAAVGVDTTIGRQVILTHTPSLATASLAGMQYTFESMN